MIAVMKKLDITIPEFRLRRFVKISTTPNKDKLNVAVEGVDVDGIPASIFKTVAVAFSESCDLKTREYKLEQEPFQIGGPLKAFTDVKDASVAFTFKFYGHYKEPSLAIQVPLTAGKAESKTYMLEYNPFTGKWSEPLDVEKWRSMLKSDPGSNDKKDGTKENKSEVKDEVKSVDEKVADLEKHGFSMAKSLAALKASKGDYASALAALQKSGSASVTPTKA